MDLQGSECSDLDNELLLWSNHHKIMNNKERYWKTTENLINFPPTQTLYFSTQKDKWES